MWTKMPQSKVDDISMGKIYIRGHFKGAMLAPTHARADENSLCAQKSSESWLTNNAKCVTQTSVNKLHHSYMKQIVCKAQRVVKRQQTVQNSVLFATHTGRLDYPFINNISGVTELFSLPSTWPWSAHDVIQDDAKKASEWQKAQTCLRLPLVPYDTQD